MSALSELMREGPAYKKAALAVAVTAGVGACVYIGYRCATGSKKPGRGPSKPEEKRTSQEKVSSSAKEKVTPPKKEEVVSKPVTTKIDPLTVSSSPKPASPKLDVSHAGASLRSDELSTSGTFEKISLGPNESDNFVHLTMSQVQPLESSSAQVGKAEGQGSKLVTSTASPKTTSDIGASILSQPDMFENLSMSQAEQSMSFISTPGEELGAGKGTKRKDPGFSEQHSGAGASGSVEDTSSVAFSSGTVKEPSSVKVDEARHAAAASGVKLKDENDIVVVVPSSEEPGSEKSEEDRGPRSGMASTILEFDASSMSPVFGHQSYQRVHVEPEELDAFDPAKSHPASFGFKFDSNI